MITDIIKKLNCWWCSKKLIRRIWKTNAKLLSEKHIKSGIPNIKLWRIFVKLFLTSLTNNYLKVSDSINQIMLLHRFKPLSLTSYTIKNLFWINSKSKMKTWKGFLLTLTMPFKLKQPIILQNILIWLSSNYFIVRNTSKFKNKLFPISKLIEELYIWII